MGAGGFVSFITLDLSFLQLGAQTRTIQCLSSCLGTHYLGFFLGQLRCFLSHQLLLTIKGLTLLSFLNPQCPLSPVLAIHGNFKELVLRTWKFLEIIFVQSYLGYLRFILG